MAITEIDIERRYFEAMGRGTTDLPLDPPLRMRSLGRVVVLAGANGAGKTRLLRLLSRVAPVHQDPEFVAERLRTMRTFEDSSEALQSKLQEEELQQSAAPTDFVKLASLRQEIGSHKAQAEGARIEAKVAGMLTCDISGIPKLVDFCPTQPRLVDPAGNTDNHATQQAEQMRSAHGVQANEAAPSYARHLLRAELLSHRRRASEAEVGADEIAAAGLKDLVTTLLGVQAQIDLDDSLNLTIGGRRDYPETLSAGQQILFQFACLLHAKGTSIRDCIVLMDEPENHLHPGVLAQVIDAITVKLSQGGQLWISTHSVPLIAHLVKAHPDCLWYVKDGSIKHAGRSPEAVLYSLMGGPEGAIALHDFTQLPAQYAALKFMSECLVEPGVVGVNVKDAQTNQIASIVAERRKNHQRRTRLLDFGAGKARLLATLSAIDPMIQSSLDYLAFDPSSDHEAQRQSEIAAIYGTASERTFNSLDQLTARLDEHSVDLIVMCNVLHEIDPQTWMLLFGSKGVVPRLLGPDGALLVVEDYGIPIGERAHDFGFLLLDEPELVELFCIREADRRALAFVRNSSTDPFYSNRLVAHLIAAECTHRVSHDSRFAAINCLKERMRGNVRDHLRGGGSGHTSAAGRSYALMTQLLANATLWTLENERQ